MMSNTSKITVFILAILFLNACVSPPTYPPKPKIEFVSITKSNVIPSDTFSIIFSFQDGDGDLGFENRDTAFCDLCEPIESPTSCYNNETFSIFLKDSRTYCLTTYNLPFVPPNGSTNAISGRITVVAGGGGLCCLPPSGFPCCDINSGCDIATDSIIYSIQIRDRLGNYSNEVQTIPVVVKCRN
jgi:hypothetical protein